MGKGSGKGGKPVPVELRQPGLIKKEIVSTSFSFYDAEEARRISVKRISNPVLFDALNNPVQDGLYDPALGPIDKKGSCATCRLSAMHCPGHFGHIELAVPVYNPLTFGTVVRLLRSMCLHCHRFKMGTDRVGAYSRKMELIRAGDLNAAAEISTTGVSKQVREALGNLEADGLGFEVGDVDTTTGKFILILVCAIRLTSCFVYSVAGATGDAPRPPRRPHQVDHQLHGGVAGPDTRFPRLSARQVRKLRVLRAEDHPRGR